MEHFTEHVHGGVNTLSPHCSMLPDQRTFAEEFQVFEVTGLVTLARLDIDHDVHVVLADPMNRTRTMITEVVDPACDGAAQSPFLSILSDARTVYQTLGLLAGKTVRVQGAGSAQSEGP